MSSQTMEIRSRQVGRRKGAVVPLTVSALGIAATLAGFGVLRNRIINPVTYRLEPIDVPAGWIQFVGPVAAVLGVVLLGIQRHRLGREARKAGPPAESAAGPGGSAVRAAWPLGLSAVTGGLWLVGMPPTFIGFCLALGGMGWALDRLGRDVPTASWFKRVDPVAPWLLLAAVVGSTLWHALMQVKFWEHFLLGYADFGFFTTELEHCLPWKDVGPARFSDTRMGYHCVPMFYALVPLYALMRSPVFLMVVGPLALNVAAVPFYRLARERTSSATLALFVALAWLALPSITRLPYSNTYGFQSIYLAVPWLAASLTLAMRGRWRASHLCLAAALLCEETVCGVAFGWGVYLMLWGGRRRDGVWISALSIGYLLVTTQVLIPHFAASSEYTRLMLFGDLTPAEVVRRLLRPRAAFLLLALIVPLLPGLWRGRRLLIAAAPTLFLVLVLQQDDYLNVKYWHQSSILPVLFVAVTMGVTGQVRGRPRVGPLTAPSVWPAVGMFLAVLVLHQWLGSSPLAQSNRVYAAEHRLQTPDPRMAAVDYVRAHFRPETTTVVATERMAAHFIDYRMVRPAPEVRLADAKGSAHVLIVDRTDGWDKIVLERQLGFFLEEARNAGYVPVHTEGPVLILANEHCSEIIAPSKH